MVKKEVVDKKVRVQVVIPQSILERLDQRKVFPAWSNNRSKLVVAAVIDFLNQY